jgi:hypothetical protein
MSKIQVNEWEAEKYRFESYGTAKVFEGARIMQGNDHHSLGQMFMLVDSEEHEIATMYGGSSRLGSGMEWSIRGFVMEHHGLRPTGVFRPQIWFVLGDED